ncbi:MAG: hypothetical protein KGO96_03725 [Elusimicrobia bacterium]|nr:hypothetical protein [Elusimicrobiota bacterium]MDE2238172.1 hypothetical protein [Elusimicrobiota bacterium]MDE2425002.1 hypothetical protein [Elusimicrobiota bacterium]
MAEGGNRKGKSGKSDKSGKKLGKRKLIKRVRKDAAVFLSSEEGKMIKKNIVKTAIALGLIASASDLTPAGAQHYNTPHYDSPHSDFVVHHLHNDGATSYHDSGGHSDAAHADQAAVNYHANHGNHGNHGNHSNHGSGGWC